MNKFIPVNTPLLSGNEKKYINECIDTGWISSEGPFVKKFEKSFSSYIGMNNGIAVSSGSAALDIAFKSLELNPGDEVIAPTFTIISPIQSIINSGCKPVLIDCDINSFNMNVGEIEKKINHKTKAILVVHIYGLPVDLDPILILCKKYNIKLIEDAAEVHGLDYNGKKCGSFGDISIFSFYPNKHITTGEGGMILCNDFGIEQKCRKLRNLAFESSGRRFIHNELGWNYRMTNMQAAIGLAQLEKIEYHIKLKRKIGELYTNKLSCLKNFKIPIKENKYSKNIYWVYSLIANNEANCEKAIKYLSKNGIGTRPFFWNMHEQPVFRKMGLFLNNHFPVSELISRTGFYIPSGLGLSESDINFVSDRLIELDKNL